MLFHYLHTYLNLTQTNQNCNKKAGHHGINLCPFKCNLRSIYLSLSLCSMQWRTIHQICVFLCEQLRQITSFLCYTFQNVSAAEQKAGGGGLRYGGQKVETVVGRYGQIICLESVGFVWKKDYK